MRSWCLALILSMALGGCTPGRSPVQGAAELPEEAAVLDGQILLPPDPNPDPGQTTPSLSPTTAPSEAPYTPFSVDVAVYSDHADLNTAPPPGEPETYRSTAKVSALVTMSNGYHNQDVTWESSSPEMATVDAYGNVQGVGTMAGTVSIVAYARDRKASGSITLQVTNLGDAELSVN